MYESKFHPGLKLMSEDLMETMAVKLDPFKVLAILLGLRPPSFMKN